MSNKPIASRVLEVNFPFQTVPDILIAERTALLLGSARRVHLWSWCYLDRDISPTHLINWRIEPSSFSRGRAKGLTELLVRFNEVAKVQAFRPTNLETMFRLFARFLNWNDSERRRINDLDLLLNRKEARRSLEAYNSYATSLIASGKLRVKSAAQLVGTAEFFLKKIHGNQVSEDLTLLKMARGRPKPTPVPPLERTSEYLQLVTQFFDQTAEAIASNRNPPLHLKMKHVGFNHEIDVGKPGDTMDVAHTASLCFAALAMADSGTNLSLLIELTYDSNIAEQLKQPDVSSSRRRVIKFRAANKLVPIDFSLATVQRCRKYLLLRDWMLGGTHGNSFFIAPSRKGMAEIPTRFLAGLARRFKTFTGLTLPKINAREWRAYKQHHLIINESLPVAASLMGHTIETALRAYSNGRERDRAVEFGNFFDSLTLTVISRKRLPHETPIPPGSCADYQKPNKTVGNVPIVPDCKNQQGCISCDKYRIHPDETDIRKLLSFRHFLRCLSPKNDTESDYAKAHEVTLESVERILDEIKLMEPSVYGAIETEVDEYGKLTQYWKNKLHQLAFLGFI